MRISSIRIENFRSFDDATIPLNNFTGLVGPNGAGKSTVLTALNVFFREMENFPAGQLEEEDFHCKNTSDPIRITVTFCDLSDEAQKDFSDYARQGQLTVMALAVFDEATGKAYVKQLGQRLGMTAFRPFFEALDDGKKVVELKTIYNEIRQKLTVLPAPSTKESMVSSLREFEAERPSECELIQSEDQFYGFSKGTNRLSKHVQWVYIPAVKDASSEQAEARNSALGKLLAHTVRSKTKFDELIGTLRTQARHRYQELLDGNQDALRDISVTLQSRISEWAHPGARLRLQWKQDPEKSVRVEEPLAHIVIGEGEFEGELTRFGHGLQRSYLLALLQELAGVDDDAGPTLILACEEPELYQHPPQARHLAAVLNNLSHGNAQVLVSTHNPRFISGQGFEDVRMIRKDIDQRCTAVAHVSFDQIAQAIANATGATSVKPQGVLAKIHQALQPALNEMFFTRKLILVEGIEDVAYIMSYISLLEKEEEFRLMGCYMVATNGKSELLQPLVIARQLAIPTYVVFDADADKPDQNGSEAKHKKDNRSLLSILEKKEANPMPTDNYSGTGFTMWHSDIGSVVKDDIGKDEWMEFRKKADIHYGQAGRLRKNPLHIGSSLAFAWEAGMRSASLENLCATLLKPESYL